MGHPDTRLPCPRTATDRYRPAGSAPYASWANPIKTRFGPLRQFTLAKSHHRSHPAQTRALHRKLHGRNANACHPDVLATQH
ncbi:hypothetical protein [Streptomyces sp. SID12501]|uniref:hypothetical protein n=1 Tax=Streptomyces sp. SID12501 TaxID=2706042 RepID=UPI001EF300E8|nr:hypothetical protein [Streptomyces sp. SID12501]